MKISRNWLNDYITSKSSDDELVESFTQLGLECTVTPLNFNYKNIVIGKVLSCVKHPNADKLKLCEVDIGSDVLNIVCGAPNIKKNINVPIAKPGAIINSFKIKKTKIRNVESNGMICSGKELLLTDDHSGIMILDNKLNKGDSLMKALALSNDSIFDFDLTPNRGDCFSHIGIARELSILENKKIINTSSKLKFSNFKTSELIKVNVENVNICKRYACKVIKNIKVSESPQWLKNRLHLIGQPSINNIVDLANYIMFDLGQPLHVFDYNKISGKEINVRLAKNKEKILCLNNDLKTLNKEDIVIADSEGPIAIAGVIGGYNSQVTDNTRNILIESAVFNKINIRKTSKKHDYLKEASKRFERGLDVENVLNVIDKFSEILLDSSQGEISKDFVDLRLEKSDKRKIKFDFKKCNIFLGISLNAVEYKNIFSKLSIKGELENNIFNCSIPSFRNDITRDVDLYEEVARVYGYNNIPSNSSFNISEKSFVYDESILEDKIRNILSLNGFNEHISNSLYSKKDILLNKDRKALEIVNPLSKDMKYLRNYLLPGLLKTISYNEKRNLEFLKIYEIGSTNKYNSKLYNKSEELRELGIIWTVNKTQHWKHPLINDIFTIKGEISRLFDLLNLSSLEFIHKNKKIESLKIKLNKIDVGVLYKIENKILKEYEIRNSAYYCNIFIDKLNKVIEEKNVYEPISNYPSIIRDISISVNKKISNDEIIKVVKNNGGEFLKDIILFDFYINEEDIKDNKSLAYSLVFYSNERTLIDKDIDKVIKKVLLSLKNKYGIVQR